jgi:hypothetical protein
MVTLELENWVVIPPRFVLGVPRPLCMANMPVKYDSCYIELEVATWIQANRGLIEGHYDQETLKHIFEASFMESDAAMLFKLTYPPE